MWKFVIAALSVQAFLLAGCADPEISLASFQRQRIDGVSLPAVYDAAERAVADRFRISGRDRSAGLIHGTTFETGVVAASGRMGSPPRVRRLAEVRLRQEGSGVEVFCRVSVQENATDSVRILRSEHGTYDEPHQTPADREAGTTESQNTVWRNRRRDRGMEREILESVRDALGGVAASDKRG